MSRLPALTRLVRLLTARHARTLSLRDICDELECAEKTADRYIRELRDTHGYPIEYVRDLGGYRMAPTGDNGVALELPGLFFNESELSALITLRHLLSQVEPGIFERDLLPLGRRVERLLAETGVEPTEVARRIRILAIGTRRAPDRAFRACADAVLSRRRLRVAYRPRFRDGEWQERELSPQRLVRYRDNWYLDAWCHERKAVRVFALDQMRDARILLQAAHDVPEDELDREVTGSYGIFTGAPTARAVLRFSARRAQWVAKEEWHGSQQGRFLADGSWELSVPYDRPEELLMDILKHGPEVEVVEPESLRRQVADLVRQTAVLYDREPIP